MKRVTIFAVLFGFIAVSLSFIRPALTDQQSAKQANEPAALKQLQKERIDTFERIERILTEQFKIGAATFTDLSKAQEDLFKAKLDATDKPVERIALLEEQLKAAQGVLDFVEKRYKAGFGNGTELNFLHAKANCLGIEIVLAKEREKTKPAG